MPKPIPAKIATAENRFPHLNRALQLKNEERSQLAIVAVYNQYSRAPKKPPSRSSYALYYLLTENTVQKSGKQKTGEIRRMNAYTLQREYVQRTE